MKKLSVILTILLAASLLLAACSNGKNESTENETQTAVPGSLATGQSTVATEAPTATLAPTATTAAAPVMTSTAVVTSTAAATGLPSTGGEKSPARASNIMDSHLYNQKGDDLGSIKNLILDFRKGTATYALLQSGGFLGLGAKNILIPFSKMQYNNGKGWVLTANDNLVKNSPDIDLEHANLCAPNWDTKLANYWASGALPTGTPEALVPTAPAATATPTQVMTGTATETALAATPLTCATWADKFTGKTVVDRHGNELGKVNDIILNPQTGALQYALVAASNDLGIGDKYIPVPVSLFRTDAKGDLVSPAPKSTLVKAPNFDKNNLPDFSAPNWDSKVGAFWSSFSS